jgi:D-arabinose 1-dehydrogenase-like Zn-dependent alcohol dehydrogenase
VKHFKPGDLAAVGCMVDSDGTCEECKAGLEQFCPNLTLTYNFPDKHTSGVTYGGYSDSIVVDERFVLRVPENLNLAGTAPAVRGDHDVLPDEALGGDAGQESGAWWDWAGWATWQ